MVGFTDFYNGLNQSIKTSVDAAAGGTLMGKSEEEAYNLIEEMSSNNFQWSNEKKQQRKVAGMYEVDKVDMLSTKIDTLLTCLGS